MQDTRVGGNCESDSPVCLPAGTKSLTRSERLSSIAESNAWMDVLMDSKFAANACFDQCKGFTWSMFQP